MERACGYCDQPITDNRYTYKWFPAEDGGLMKPVHNWHLSGKRGIDTRVQYEEFGLKNKEDKNETNHRTDSSLPL